MASSGKNGGFGEISQLLCGFSSSTVNDEREEKISLCITTLLSMSVLIFYVSDQMPSTSSFVPLICWFYIAMALLITGGALASSFVIYIQKKGIVGQRPSSTTSRWYVGWLLLPAGRWG